MYAYVGCWAKVANPRLLSIVLYDVGLFGSGESGDLNGARGVTGDLSERTGLLDCAADVETGAMLMESLGFMALAGSIVNEYVWCWSFVKADVLELCLVNCRICLKGLCDITIWISSV